MGHGLASVRTHIRRRLTHPSDALVRGALVKILARGAVGHVLDAADATYAGCLLALGKFLRRAAIRALALYAAGDLGAGAGASGRTSVVLCTRVVVVTRLAYVRRRCADIVGAGGLQALVGRIRTLARVVTLDALVAAGLEHLSGRTLAHTRVGVDRPAACGAGLVGRALALAGGHVRDLRGGTAEALIEVVAECLAGRAATDLAVPLRIFNAVLRAALGVRSTLEAELLTRPGRGFG